MKDDHESLEKFLHPALDALGMRNLAI